MREDAQPLQPPEVSWLCECEPLPLCTQAAPAPPAVTTDAIGGSMGHAGLCVALAVLLLSCWCLDELHALGWLAALRQALQAACRMARLPTRLTAGGVANSCELRQRQWQCPNCPNSPPLISPCIGNGGNTRNNDRHCRRTKQNQAYYVCSTSMQLAGREMTLPAVYRLDMCPLFPASDLAA